MAIKKITIQQFHELAKESPVLDVRSPGEYSHAHIPGAYSLPLFTDEERKIVGTAYKQQGKKVAVKLGLDFFGVKMRSMVNEAESIIKDHNSKSRNGLTQNSEFRIHNSLIVHCWRGGMRSAGVAWLLDLYGFEVYTLIGGYKAYRNWVLGQFEKNYNLVVVGGYTGSGKTGVIEQLLQEGNAVINLEKLANHKGSAFGAMGEQPRQEMFENLLAADLHQQENASTIWIEDESQRIGQLNIPNIFWKAMRNKPVCFIDIPFDQRLDHIMATYGTSDKENLVNPIIRIQKRLGPLETKTAIVFLIEDNYRACFEILLSYYDKQYNKALHSRENLGSLLSKITCSSVDTLLNTQKLLTCSTVNI